jgi:WD40 repeat protein/serine/threonine protein kinase
MSANTPCPDSRRLEGLLHDSLPLVEQSALTEHVGACSACQQALDGLAGGPEPERLRDAQIVWPDSGSAYWAAMEGLEKEITEELPARGQEEGSPRPRQPRILDVPLDFLSASDDPAHLGMLDHFAILGVIGRGGMGLVLRGLDTCLQREVAVKVLDPALAEDETAQHRFCREARAAASITHENVVAVHHVAEEETSEVPYLVMQMIEGESLEERLAQTGTPDVKEIVRIGREIAEGLAAAHAKGLIHRDVKPANVLLEQGTGRVKLTDFGLARAAEDVRLTRSGMVTGTPLYMAPEQARGEEVDHRSDLFSLGVLLYELCTGRTPFEAKTPLAVMQKLTDERHSPIRELRPDMPAWLVDVIDRLLAKSPADRFQSAREVADLLDQYWSAMKTSSEVIPACPHKRRRRIQLALLLLAAVVAGALVTALAVRFWPSRAGDTAAQENSPPALAVLRGNSGTVWGVSFSPDDRTLAMGIEDGTIKLWDLEAKNVRATLTGHRASVWSAAFNRDGKLLITSSDDNTARVWDLARSSTVKTLTTSAAVRVALLGPDDDSVYTGDRGGNVRVWSLATGNELRSWRHSGAIYTLALSPDGKTVATAGSDRVIRLHDTTTGQERLSLNGHAGQVYGLAYRPDGKVLASAGWDHVIRLWNAGTGDLLRSLEGHSNDVWAVAFAPDGKTLASVGQDGTVRVWDAETGAQLSLLRGHDGAVHSVVFSRDGSRIASGGRDGTVHVWEAVRTGG